jgi:hypothetical protein
MPVAQFEVLISHDTATATIYSGADDRQLTSTNATFAGARDDATGGVVNVGNVADELLHNSWNTSLNFIMYRAAIWFDLSSIPAGSTILSAVLSLFVSNNNRWDDGAPQTGMSICAAEAGYPSQPPVTGDYDRTRIGAAIATTTSFTANAYNDFVIPVGNLVAGAQNPFYLRIKGDVDNTAPTSGTNHYNQMGAYLGTATSQTHRPRLVITYIPATVLTTYSGADDRRLSSTAETTFTGARDAATAPSQDIGDVYSHLIHCSGIVNGGTHYYIYRGAIHFDLSAIPADATIISATLGLYIVGTAFDDGPPQRGLSVCVPVYSYPSRPAVDADYVKTRIGAAVASVTSFTNGIYNDFTIPAVNITPGGWNAFYLRMKGDVDNTAPGVGGTNYVETYLGTATLEGHRPRLVITYMDTGPFIKYTDNSNDSRIMGREFHHTENHPRKVVFKLDNATTVAADNLLSSSFTGWSDGVAQALDEGDSVRYYLYPTLTGEKTRVFDGAIQKMSEGSDGILTVEACDWLQWFENQKIGKTVYKNYRDSVKKDLAWVDANNRYEITGITDAGILQPLVSLQVASNDECIDLGDSGDSTYNIKQAAIAQKFYATKPLMCGVGLSSPGLVHSPPDVQFKILPCNSSGNPDTTAPLLEGTIGVDGGTTGSPWYWPWTYWFDEPLELVVGRPYYIYLNEPSATDQYVDIEDAPRYEVTEYKYWNGAAWVAVTDHVLLSSIHQAEYVDVPPGDYAVDEAADKIYIYKRPSGMKQAKFFNAVAGMQDEAYVNKRCLLHYYYGTRTLEEAFTSLIGLDPDVTASVSTDCDRTLPLYRTKGKSLGECLRELSDLFETSGTYSGYQHAIGHYRLGGIDYIKAGHRYALSDASVATFSDSSATDEELRITGCSLTKKAGDRPSGVIVVGKDAFGYPLVAARDDRGKADSFRVKCKFPVVEQIFDDNLKTLADVNDAAFRYLDSVSRDIWEGQITVSGIYPELMRLLTSSKYYGSGRIITLNYAKLGISALKMKVTGIVVREDSTEITVNNTDSLLVNWLTKTVGRSEKSESFTSPEDLQGHYFFSCWENAVHDGTYYMQLCNASGVAITGSTRVLCTKFPSASYSSGGYNTISYHAEFEMDNGYTIDGTDVITHIELYAAATGGSAVTQYALRTAEQFPKWKTQRIICEYTVKAS